MRLIMKKNRLTIALSILFVLLIGYVYYQRRFHPEEHSYIDFWTAITGIGTVAAAVFAGLYMHGQNEILMKQNKIITNDIRLTLFDKRLAVYEKVLALVLSIATFSIELIHVQSVPGIHRRGFQSSVTASAHPACQPYW